MTVHARSEPERRPHPPADPSPGPAPDSKSRSARAHRPESQRISVRAPACSGNPRATGTHGGTFHG